MASLTQLSSVDKKRVARLVQQLLHNGHEHEAAKVRWAMEMGCLSARMYLEMARHSAETAERAAAECSRSAAWYSRCEELSAQNTEVVAETVELRAKLVKALKLVKGYQLQLIELRPALAPAPVQYKDAPAAAQRDTMPQATDASVQRDNKCENELFSSDASSSDSDDEGGRRERALNALRLAYEGEVCGEPTAEDLDAAVASVADVRASLYPLSDEEEEVRLAGSLLDATVPRRAKSEQLLELGMGIGRFCVAAFVLRPRALRVVRGVELCPSRFSIAERALRRLAAASRAERSWRRSHDEPRRLLPRLELAAASAGLIRLRGRNGRVLEFRRGDLFDTPSKALAAARLVTVATNIPAPRQPALAALVAALPAEVRLVLAKPPAFKDAGLLLAPLDKRRRVDGLYLCTRTNSKATKRPVADGRSGRLKPPAEVFKQGEHVIVAQSTCNRHGRQSGLRSGRVVAQLPPDFALSILYSDGTVEDSVSLDRCRRDLSASSEDAGHRLEPSTRSTIKARRSFASSRSRCSTGDRHHHDVFDANTGSTFHRPPQPRLASSQWVSIWDEDT